VCVFAATTASRYRPSAPRLGRTSGDKQKQSTLRRGQLVCSFFFLLVCFHTPFLTYLNTKLRDPGRTMYQLTAKCEEKIISIYLF